MDDEADPTPRRDGDYVGCLAGNLRAATRAVTRFYDDALRPHGLRITQIALLAQLERLQPATSTELAAAVGGERSGVTRDLARLEDRGLVGGSPHPDDQRARHLHLTPAGATALAECAPAWRAAQAAMADLLGPGLVAELVTAAGQVTSQLGRAGSRP